MIYDLFMSSANLNRVNLQKVVLGQNLVHSSESLVRGVGVSAGSEEMGVLVTDPGNLEYKQSQDK